MPWTIPDKGEGDNDLQSILFQEYLEVLVAGLSGQDCVLDGCVVTGGADMTPAVAVGNVRSNGVVRAVTAGDVTIGAAHATNPRLDLIVVDSTGAKQVRAGTAAANPKPPARSANDVVLAAVYVPANDTSIETTKCIDMRVVRTSSANGIIRVGSSILAAPGAAITLVAPVGLTKMWGHAFVKAPGALVPRLFLGGAAVDGGLNYAATVALANVNGVSTTSFNGWNLIVAALANGNRTTIDFWIQKSAAAEMARSNWKHSGISSAITVAPTLTEGCGLWGNTADLMQRIELRGKTAITGNTDANMDTGSQLTVYGSYE